MATIVKYVRVQRYVSRRSHTRDRAGTTYVFYAATPRTHCARPTRPLSSLSETDGAWRNGEGQRETERKLESALEKERRWEREREREPAVCAYWRIHFIGRKNPPGNYRQIYADIRRMAIAKGISRSNVATWGNKRGRTWENKACIDDKSRHGRSSPS